MVSPRRGVLALALAVAGAACAACAAPAWWRRSSVLREVKSKSELEPRGGEMIGEQPRFMDVYGCLWMFMDVYGC